MREKFEDLKFKIMDIQDSLGMRYYTIPDWVKAVAVYVCVSLLLIIYTLFYLDAKNYKPQELPESVNVKIDVAEETLLESDKLVEEGNYGAAFDLLATHRNHFSSEYSKSDMERLETRLVDLTQHAVDADIEALYASEDLTEQQPLLKFTGIIVEINDDPMYGVTYMVSNNGERSQEQLEVTGLADVSVNSIVEFYGVPTFNSVASPIKVEAYVLPIE